MRKKNTSPSRDDQSARLRVLAAATRIFTQKGYAATSVREIVEAAGVTKPILYYYFGNKEGIYLEILEDVSHKYNQLMEDGLRFEGSAHENILKFGSLFYRAFAEHLPEARLIHSIFYGPQQGAPPFDFDSFHMKFRQAVKRLVNRAVQTGAFKSYQAELLEWTILAIINFANETQMVNSNQSVGEGGLERMLRMILRGASQPAKQGVRVYHSGKLGSRQEGRRKNAGQKI